MRRLEGFAGACVATLHRLSVRRCALCAALLLASSSATSCGIPTTFRFVSGYATYFVELYDTVIDSSGQSVQAYCANYATFVGEIDTLCPSYPMIWSYAQYVWMQCSYRDATGIARYYTDSFYFPPGYIQDNACIPGGLPIVEADGGTTSRTAGSELSRDAEGRVLLPGSISVDPSLVAPLATSRADLEERIGVLPGGLSSEVGAAVRVGPAHPAVADPDATFE